MKREYPKRMCATLALLACTAAAQAAVTVDDAWVRATAPGQPVAGGYMKIRSSEQATLVGVKTPLTSSAEIHEMSMEGGVMRMRPVRSLTLPANAAVELKPSGYHLMLMDLRRPLKAGEKVPLTLIVEHADKKREEVKIEAEVRSSPPGGGHAH